MNGKKCWVTRCDTNEWRSLCDGVGLSLAEAANELALFNVERVV